MGRSSQREGEGIVTAKANGLTLTGIELGVAISLLLSAGSIVFSAGVIWTTVQTHERDIEELKSKRADTVDRLARIETKLDIALRQNAED